MKLPAATSRPLVNLVLGAAVLAVGLVMAHQWLPEWRLQRLPPRAVFAARYRALAGRLGVHLALGEPRTDLSTTRRVDQTICPGSSRAFSAICSETRVTVTQMGTMPGEPLPRELVAGWTTSGEMRSLVWAVPTTVLFSAKAPIPRPPWTGSPRLSWAPASLWGFRASCSWAGPT